MSHDLEAIKRSRGIGTGQSSGLLKRLTKHLTVETEFFLIILVQLTDIKRWKRIIRSKNIPVRVFCESLCSTISRTELLNVHGVAMVVTEKYRVLRSKVKVKN
jgi:hypothetical protein